MRKKLAGIVTEVLAVGTLLGCRTFPQSYDYEIKMERKDSTYLIFVDEIKSVSPKVWVYRDGKEVKDFSAIEDNEVGSLVESLQKPYNGCVPLPRD